MYLDPGFGSMVIQGIIAGIAMGGVVLFSIRNKIIAFFQRNKAKPETAAVNIPKKDDNFEKIEDDE
jgi:hypothetical protein